jgi:flavorubredoxin
MYKVEHVTGKIYWHGIRHWQLRSFHGNELSTHRGSTYNAYVIKDEKTVLVDTVWDVFQDEWVESLDREVGLKNIDMVVVNHNEPDHGGSLGALVPRLRPGVPIYCSKGGGDCIQKHFHQEGWNIVPVKTGDSVNIGEYDLVFVEFRMIHWPDSMVTYVKGAKAALTNDAFGQHYCRSELFNDLVDEAELYEEAIKYFANILTPYSALIQKKVPEVLAMGLEIEYVCPSHGVLWRKDAAQIIRKYAEWSDPAFTEGFAVIAYDSFYKSTPAMADAFARGVASEGVAYKLFHVATTDVNDLLTNIFKSAGVALGSSTINNTMHRTMAALLDEIEGHRFRNKVGAAFGSYGWSGEAPKLIAGHLRDGGIEVVGDPLRVQFAPTQADLDECAALGARFAARIKERLKPASGHALDAGLRVAHKRAGKQP